MGSFSTATADTPRDTCRSSQSLRDEVRDNQGEISRTTPDLLEIFPGRAVACAAHLTGLTQQRSPSPTQLGDVLRGSRCGIDHDKEDAI